MLKYGIASYLYPMQRLSTFLHKKGYTFIPLIKVASGHYICTAEINGIKGRFIVDSGASHTCVALEKEKHFEIIAFESDEQAATASSQDVDTKQSTSNQIRLGDWVGNKQELVVIHLETVNVALDNFGVEQVDGILGANLLHKTKAILDFKQNRLYLKK